MVSRHLISYFLFLCFAGICYGSVLFSSLSQTLVVHASPKQGDVLKAGDDNITVTWELNQSLQSGTDEAYMKVKFMLCYAPISQQDRPWRKTNDLMNKDKTCSVDIVEIPYNSFDNKAEHSFQWTIERQVPTATYFVRAYAYNSVGDEVAFGQTTDGKKTTYLFDIKGISGSHGYLDITAGCFSAFSVLSLIGFFYVEKKKAKRFERR